MTVRLAYVVTVPITLEVLLRGQIGFMKKRGMEVMAVCSPGPGLAAVAEREDMEVHPVPMKRGISPRADLAALVRLVRLFRETRPTIVNASTGKAGPLAMAAAALAGVPVKVYCLRGIMVDRGKGPVRHVLKMVERTSCGLADRVLAVSESVRRFVVEEGLCDPSKIVVPSKGSSNGVDAEGRFDPDLVDTGAVDRFRRGHGLPDDRFLVGFVGRLVRGKGIVELAEAWQYLRHRHDDTHLVLAGPEEPQDPVSPVVMDRLRRDPRVTMIDFVPNEEMPLFYSVTDLLVLPSHSEGFPNVVLEAAAMRKPVVATSAPGCVDAVVDGVTGTLVPVRESRAVARAVEAYLSDPGLRERHGRAARERVLRDYSPERVWGAVPSQYERLLERKELLMR
jgi:glycosyltransferase involved in cell wall biosynthesis